VAAVVLAHGLSGSARSWDRNRAALADRFEVHAVDLHAVSRPFVLAEAADHLVAWMSERDLSRASLVGHSMGAAVALDLAARFPERVERLVLVDAAVRPMPLRRRLGGAVVSGWRSPVSLKARTAADALRAGPVTLWRATRQVLEIDLTTRLSAVQAPTLVVWGELDTLVPLENGRDLVASLPDARLSVIPGAGHAPMWERPAAFNELVLDFLAPETAD
jgi:pimeloyl-ACP methyl ester carboxylesterase